MNRFSISVGLVYAGFLACPVVCQTTPQPGPSKLQVVVRADRETYRISDTVRLETDLVNTGEQDVYVWNWDLCWNPARGLSLHFVTPDGTFAKGKVLLDCVKPPPLKGDPYQFVKLEPMRFHGRVDDFKIADLVEAPGEYDVERSE